MDILQLLMEGSGPEARQRAMAEQIRGRQALAAALQQGQQQASQYDMLNFATQAAGNNPGLAAGVGGLQKSAQAKNKVTPVGQSSLIVGDQLLENPEFAAQKDSDRQGRLLQAAAMMQQRREAEQSRADRDEQNRALRMTLAGMSGGARADARAARDEARAEKDEAKREAARAKYIETGTQRYSQTMTKEGIPEFFEAMDMVDEVLQNPKNSKDIPGYGRLESLLPSRFASDDVQQTRSTMAKAANILLKSRSGAAVTAQEHQRFLTEVAEGVGMSEAALRHGWNGVRRSFEAKAAGLAAGYDDVIHEEYVKRGGKDARKGRVVRPGAPAAPAVADPDDDMINKYLKKK